MAYVLIVDDDEDFANTAAAVLRTEGYEVQIELDTEEGRQSMESRCPDLVILDVMFPESNTAGFELAHIIRNHDENFRSIPILMLTAVDTEFPHGFRSGENDNCNLQPEDFLEKPVDFDTLLIKVSRMLQGK